MGNQEDLYGVRQQLIGNRFRRRDAHPAPHETPELLDARADRLEFGNGVTCVSDEQLTRRCWPDAAWQSLEQRRAKLSLQIDHLPVERGGSDVERVRGFADRSMTGNGIHIGEYARGSGRLLI